MKIIHVSTATSWRGGEQQIAYLISGLREENIPQLIVCPTDTPLHRYCLEHNYPVVTFTKKISTAFRMVWQLSRLCREGKDVILHAHDSHAHTMVWLSGILFSNKVPMMVHRRVDFPVSTSGFSGLKYNYKGIKKFICVSNAIRNILIKGLEQPEKAVVIHSGIDLKRFENSENTNLLRKEFGLEKHHILAGNVAALADHKDYPTFLHAAEEVCKTDSKFRFFIIGEGELRQETEKFIADHHLQNKIFLTGFRRDVPEILKDLDIFFMPSKMEGLGTSVLDAFASGVPVVSTYAGGIPELVTHEKTGLLSNPGDYRQMARQITRLAEDTELREVLVRQAYEKVQKMDYKHMTFKTLSLYREILTGE